MNIGKLLMQNFLVTSYGSYKMDNSYKGLDGTIYRSNNNPDDLCVKDLMNMDINCALLTWSDFADSHRSDHVELKDRDI
jgi:hypothetical protein